MIDNNWIDTDNLNRYIDYLSYVKELQNYLFYMFTSHGGKDVTVKKVVDLHPDWELLYVQIHAPCCTGWYFDGSKTIEIARLAVETALYPIFEIVDGELGKVRKIKQKPVEEYLKAQRRFKHLFTKDSGKEEIARIQAIADRNVSKYDLMSHTKT